MWLFCIINAIYHIQYTSFPCRYRQNTGFAGPWEWATLTRRREPSSPVTRTHRLMKQPTAQHGGARMKHVTVKRVIMAAVMFMFIILNILIDPSNFFLFPRRYMMRWNNRTFTKTEVPSQIHVQSGLEQSKSMSRFTHSTQIFLLLHLHIPSQSRKF